MIVDSVEPFVSCYHFHNPMERGVSNQNGIGRPLPISMHINSLFQNTEAEGSKCDISSCRKIFALIQNLLKIQIL